MIPSSVSDVPDGTSSAFPHHSRRWKRRAIVNGPSGTCSTTFVAAVDDDQVLSDEAVEVLSRRDNRK